MRKLLLTIGMFAFLGMQASAQAVTTSQAFGVHATLPAATGSNIIASRVTKTGSTTTFTPVSGLLLDFNTGGAIPFNQAAGIYIPDHFFAIDVAGAGGAGAPDVTITYSGDTKPAGQATGLGVKATTTFVKVVGATGSQTESVLATHGKKRLIDLSGESIPKAQYTGGFLRMYLGVVTKDAAAVPLDPATSEPFTNSDLPGNYDGTLTISATVP